MGVPNQATVPPVVPPEDPQAEAFKKAEEHFNQTVPDPVHPPPADPPAPAVPKPAPQTTQSVPPPPQKITVAGRQFNNAAEADVYYQNLENKVASQQAHEIAAQKKQATQVSDQSLKELIFEDTDRAMEIIEERAVAKATQGVNERIETKERTQRFYTQYGDLVGKEEVVDSFVLNNIESLEGLSEKEAFERVATEVRDRLAKWTGHANTVTETLPSGGANVVGASPGTPPAAQPVETPTKSFTEQLKGLQRSKLNL